VRFLGKLSREETVRHMREAAAFISASIYGEPFANTIIEALASGTPLIGSRAGSIEEVVTDGEHGLLYDKADHEALARQMRRVLDHPQEAREMARNGVRRIEEAFTMDRVLDRTEALFGEAVGAR
jgi:glycosyltransferase involved in cell wall biosynthesis